MLHLKLLLIIEHLLGSCSLFLISPWWLTLLPSKWFPLGMGLLLEGLLDESLCHSKSYLPFFTLHPFFISLYFGTFGCIDPRRDCASFHGKNGMEAQRFVANKI
jgi:hypothetical protein